MASSRETGGGTRSRTWTYSTCLGGWRVATLQDLRRGATIFLFSLALSRNLPVQLEKTPVTWGDLAQLRFYDEYQWLVDFSVYGILVYVVTEVSE